MVFSSQKLSPFFHLSIIYAFSFRLDYVMSSIHKVVIPNMIMFLCFATSFVRYFMYRKKAKY